jgi:hypothetical protein
VHDVQAMVRVARIMDVMVRPNAGREAIRQRSDTSQHDSGEFGKGG